MYCCAGLGEVMTKKSKGSAFAKATADGQAND